MLGVNPIGKRAVEPRLLCAAYEYLFNMSHQLRKAGIKKQAPLTYISPEPFLGHFGIGGLPGGDQMPTG